MRWDTTRRAAAVAVPPGSGDGKAPAGWQAERTMGHPMTGAVGCRLEEFWGMAKDLLSEGRRVRFRARGWSMHPLVRDGDILEVRPVGGAIRTGDIVLGEVAPGRPVVHRVLRRWRGRAGCRYLVQGDWLPWPDGILTGAQVHGVAVAVERNGVRHDMRLPAMRALGFLAVARARMGIGDGGAYRAGRRLLRAIWPLAPYVS